MRRSVSVAPGRQRAIRRARWKQSRSPLGAGRRAARIRKLNFRERPGGHRARILCSADAGSRGGLLLSTVIFYAVPRPRIPSWHGGDTKRTVSVVGFNDRILLGSLGTTIESREEVMRVQFLNADNGAALSRANQRRSICGGRTVNWYSQNNGSVCLRRLIKAPTRRPAEPEDLSTSDAALPAR